MMIVDIESDSEFKLMTDDGVGGSSTLPPGAATLVKHYCQSQ